MSDDEDKNAAIAAMVAKHGLDGIVCIPRPQYEAYRAAAEWWFAENTPPEGSEDCECASCKLYAALRAAGIHETEEKTDGHKE